MTIKNLLGMVLVLGVATPGVATPQSQSDPELPTPASVLGFEPGTDRKLADWTEISDYLGRLARASESVRLDTLGKTTLGRPFLSLTISSPANLARLDRNLEIQRKLADPRQVESELEAERLIRDGRAVVLITGGIHSTEVGGYQMPMRLAYRLAAGTDEVTRKIRDEVIVLLVPSLNPDGSQMVVDWYESTLGQPWEGAGPPFLYHHYVGHDNNRDWYAFTQKETQLTVSKLHNTWHPHIVHDIHQMGSRGPRFFVPPWTDPIEPNVDPLLVAGINALGTAIAWEMYGEGKRGIVVNAIYDAWTPARAYQHYHGGVRILTETASARLATPITMPAESLQDRRDVNPAERAWNLPDPWAGGVWRLADIVDYMESGAMALLKQAALYRERWLKNFYQVGLRALGGREGWPRAFVIPAAPQNEAGLAELLRILVTGGVEVQRAGQPFTAAGRRFEAGTYVIQMTQPYSGFAKTLLEIQRYPALREYPEGPLQMPYDVTAHTLPLMMGVEVVALAEPADVELSQPISAPTYEKQVVGLSGRTRPRVAIYESWVPSMDAGWTRWVLDQHGITYRQLRDAEVRAGNLRQRHDVIILPDQSAETIVEGRKENELPQEYVGGLGAAGVRALSEFVRAGGTLVAFNRAAALPIAEFALPVSNPLAGLDRQKFFIPGSILRLELQRGHRLAAGLPARSIAWFERGLAFDVKPGGEGRVDIVARYGSGDDLLLSGWINGGEHLAGRGALAVVRHGRGQVILFGFRPQYRGQTIASFPLLFNALKAALEASSGEPSLRGGR